MSFSRESLAAYEKSAAPAPAAPVQDTAPPASAPAPAPSPAPSAADANTGPDVPVGDETSAAPADSAPADAAPDSDTTTDDADGGAPPAPANGGRARDRIEGLIVERDALRTYGEHLLKKNAELLAKLGGTAVAGDGTQAPPPAAPAPAATSTDDEPPTLEQFNFDPVELGKAQAKWLKAQVDKRVSAAMSNAQATQANDVLRAQFESRVEAFTKAHPDFSTVVSNPALPQLAPAAARSTALSEHGPAIIYHLGKNPDLAARIARMPVEQQLVQIGRLEATLATPAAPPPPAPKPSKQKSVTNAPPPPAPIPAGSAAQKDPSTMSMDEWVAAERSRKLADRQRRQQVRAAMR